MAKRLKDYTIEDRKARPMCPAKPIDFGDDETTKRIMLDAERVIRRHKKKLIALAHK
ncbi:MAG: hypothetical protein Q4F77_00020 [Acinetobacter sp.]|uniref:hypothetical protein n=1 Tax=Acinetobacter sp. TaxID=472 RepID=UPI0026DF10AF|nr:hypothetical protein [Acinetobacter sp.]MDO5541667.1 hypothetical protein [Acinetobacter sp.]